ncbi:hypothetical protein L567_3750 [Bordetella pertussis STO1-CHLA-0006]|nr:hypothetical protein L567_3750 [Bordetella pertussis STO1-CHLA-0006]
MVSTYCFIYQAIVHRIPFRCSPGPLCTTMAVIFAVYMPDSID